MPYKLQNTRYLLYTVWITFAIDYSPFKYAHLFENIVVILSEPLQCFSARRLWIKQRSRVLRCWSIDQMRIDSAWLLILVSLHGRRKTDVLTEVFHGDARPIAIKLSPTLQSALLFEKLSPTFLAFP